MRVSCGRVEDALHHGAPGPEVGLLGDQPEPLAYLAVEPLFVELERDLVDRLDVRALHHAGEIDVAEERDLPLDVGGERPLGPADQDVGLDADLHQLAHRVLGGLGLDLAGGGDVGHQRQVHEEGVVAPHFLAELADRLEERLRLDVADRAADFGDHDVVPGRGPPDRVLDLVGDVRDDLHGGAQVLAAALLVDDRLVDPAGRDVVLLGERPVDEPLVVAEVEVGLRAVVRHVHLAVLERRHRAGIDVDVRIELLHRDGQAALDEESAQRSGGDPLPEGGDDAAGHEDELGCGRASAHGITSRERASGPQPVSGRRAYRRRAAPER